MNNITKVPVRRRSSWNPPAVPEWNETTSSLEHLRDSLLKDDEVGDTGHRSQKETKLNLIETFKSQRRHDDIYTNVKPHNAKKPKPLPRRPRISSMDSQIENSDTMAAAPNQTDSVYYVLPWHPHSPKEESDPLYSTMMPIIKPAPSTDKEKHIGHADSQTDDSFLHKIIDDHLICNICNKRYQQPKMLKCLHSFCTHCLSEKNQHNKIPMGTISCPICAKDTPIPGNGVNDLEDNILLQALINDVSEHETSHEGQRSDDQVFLEESQKSSKENKILKVRNRSKTTYESMLLKKNQPLQPFLKDLPPGNFKICPQHPSRNVTHFCKPCKKLICSDCMKFDHVPSKHHYIDAALAEEQGKKVMELLLDMIKKIKIEYITSVHSLEDSYCRLHSMIHDTRKKILDQERYQIKQIKEKSAALQEEVTQLGKERAEIIEEEHKKHCEGAKMADLNQDILEHAIHKASQLELLLAKDEVVIQCNTMLKENTPKPMHKLSYLDFAEAQEDPKTTMGHLLEIERWELQEELIEREERPFQMLGYIAMYSNGDIAVTDMLNWQLTIIRQASKRCKMVENSNKALFNPFALAINKDDELLVIDQNKVKVFDKKIKFLFEVPNPFPQDQSDGNTAPSIISCLAVDKQNRIAVGNRGKQVVSLHQQDGKLLQIIGAGMIDTQLTMALGERIIYSNYQERKLISMDYKGKIMFCVSTEDKSPTGVCCDSVGFIYVAMHSMFYGKCAIHHYNRTGEHIGCMVEGLNNPLGIIFTPRNKLAVTDKDSVKIYCRV